MDIELAKRIFCVGTRIRQRGIESVPVKKGKANRNVINLFEGNDCKICNNNAFLSPWIHGALLGKILLHSNIGTSSRLRFRAYCKCLHAPTCRHLRNSGSWPLRVLMSSTMFWYKTFVATRFQDFDVKHSAKRSG